MVDVLTPAQRRACMAAIRSRDTKPEILVRQIVHGMGYRYRLHTKTLPGKPDLVLPRHHKVIFVHGCFWHMHSCRYGKVVPATNSEFWHTKRTSNLLRDRRNRISLEAAGWHVLELWECFLKDRNTLVKTLRDFLRS